MATYIHSVYVNDDICVDFTSMRSAFFFSIFFSQDIDVMHTRIIEALTIFIIYSLQSAASTPHPNRRKKLNEEKRVVRKRCALPCLQRSVNNTAKTILRNGNERQVTPFCCLFMDNTCVETNRDDSLSRKKRQKESDGYVEHIHGIVNKTKVHSCDGTQ